MRVLALLVALLFALPAQARPVMDLENVRLIHCKGGWGTGTYIGGGRMLTAWHVVENGSCVVDGRPARVLMGNATSDYAVLAVPNKRGTRISCRGFRRGEFYLAAGFAGGSTLVVTGARNVGDHASIDRIADLTVFSGRAFPGMSGGPVYDLTGRIVGIINGGNAFAGMALFRPLNETGLCQ